MSQISPPIRIILVAVIGLCAAYMLFLRPKEETLPAAPPAVATPAPAKDPNAPTSSKPGAAVQQAVKGADSAAARADAAAGGAVAQTEGGAAPGSASVTTPAAPAGQVSAPVAPVTKAVLKTLPKDVRGAVKKHKVIVMLFYNRRSYDDVEVRRELRKVERYGGQVFVDAHWIKSVARYRAITGGVNVDQSPTVVVADRNLKAETLVGYVDGQTINQMVVDALRASGGSLIKDRHLRKLDLILRAADGKMKALPAPATDATLPDHVKAQRDISSDAFRDIVNLKPPKRQAKVHQDVRVWSAQRTNLLDWQIVTFKSHPKEIKATVREAAAGGKARDKKFNAKHGHLGLKLY